ncbi:DUF3108 domain-containing protein [Variovorax terrae]|uniref:DUF3108 domain-containing protein n=1 Tax=Variovorax terrae TaxID=2923278 RepID=A0A9X1W202_9BURK|nr:DUF3108 domain-containing protein [Variovorax terrae]MCJ0764663.1 DUF3108 domain-containing protein [Variovorax terrae]
MNGAAPAVRWRPLAALGAAVVLAHLALLRAVPPAPDGRAPPALRQFITRSIEIKPAAPAPAPPAAPPAARPAPRPPRSSVSDANTPQVQVQRSFSAIDSIASEVPPPAAEAVAAAPVPPAAPPVDAARTTAFSIPGSVRLGYSVNGESRKQSYNVRSELLWLQDGSSYDARLEVSAFLMGSRTQSSAGRITAEGLAPTRFGDKQRSEQAAHFERDKGKVVFSANTPDAPLLAGAQDRLSVFLQLGAMIAGDPARYPAGTALSMQTVGAREADVWLFTVEGEEPLSLPAGTMPALKLVRSPRREFDQKVELWLAPSLGYLPVRLKLTQSNGDFADQQLRSVEKP